MAKKQQKIGLVCVALKGERLGLAQEFHAAAKASLAAAGIDIVNADAGYTLDGAEVLPQARACRDGGAVAIIYLVSTWVFANHVIDAVQEVRLPVGIWGIPEAVSFSSVGVNVVHGAMEEMDIKHRMFYGGPEDADTIEEIGVFARASGMKRHLQGARMGLVGGKSISAYPTAADVAQVKALFGTEIEHIDQIELLERARGIDDARVRSYCDMLEKRFRVEAKEEYLAKAARTALALEDLQAAHGFDLLSVKCLGEFINAYSSCCVAVAMLNDKGIVTSCQGNINATLSMYLLSYLSGDPIYFGDISVVHIRDRVARLINCGSIPPGLAASDDKVRLVDQYEYMGEGRGVCTLFCCKPGGVTFGTLGRRNGSYVMNIATGEAFEREVSELVEVRHWAQGFVRLDGDPRVFFDNILSNHSVLCYGRYERELLEFCRLAGVTPEPALPVAEGRNAL